MKELFSERNNLKNQNRSKSTLLSLVAYRLKDGVCFLKRLKAHVSFYGLLLRALFDHFDANIILKGST